MRKILFRAKALDSDEWVHGQYICQENAVFKHKMAVNWFDTKTRKHTFSIVDIDYKTLGQYTGLQDKYGVMVFEGDKVSVWRDGSNRKFTVKWREEGTPMYILYPQPANEKFWTCRSDMEQAWKVIGTIHDSSERMDAED